MKRLHIKNNHNHTFRRVLAVLLAAAMTFALAGCSPRELHIGQVEVNTGVNTAWITPARGVDKFDIPASDFSAGADGSVTYTGTAYRALQGIDVSTFQQDIDWQAVADSGIAFAVIRAGYRGYGKGSIVEDDRFRQNVAGARAAGLHVGLYFFSQAVTPEEAAEEAQWLVDAAHDYQIDMPLVFDWENIDQSTVAAGFPVLTQYFHDRLCPGRTFRDMPEPDFWSHAGLDYCIGAGLMAGTSDVTVSPEALATRAQIVQLLWAAAGSPETAGALPFTDVAPDAWYYAAVRWAYRTGLVAGTSATTFDPDAPITRQDFTVILYEQSGRPVTTGSALTAFPDVGSVAGYAYAALTWAVEQGLVSGVGADDGVRLTPRGYASRAQVAAILMLYCDRETA